MSTSSKVRDNIVTALCDALGVRIGDETSTEQHPALASFGDTAGEAGIDVLASITIALVDATWTISVVDAEPGDETYVLVISNGTDEPDYYDLEEQDRG